MMLKKCITFQMNKLAQKMLQVHIQSTFLGDRLKEVEHLESLSGQSSFADGNP